MSLKFSSRLANQLGFDTFDSTVIYFRVSICNVALEELINFEFSSRSGASTLQRAWEYSSAFTGKVQMGGHVLQDGRRWSELDITLCNCPIRNFEQGGRRIFKDPRPRVVFEKK